MPSEFDHSIHNKFCAKSKWLEHERRDRQWEHSNHEVTFVMSSDHRKAAMTLPIHVMPCAGLQSDNPELAIA